MCFCWMRQFADIPQQGRQTYQDLQQGDDCTSVSLVISDSLQAIRRSAARALVRRRQ